MKQSHRAGSQKKVGAKNQTCFETLRGPVSLVGASLSDPRTQPGPSLREMPPKKVEPEEKLGPWALGRFTSNLKVNLARPRLTADRASPPPHGPIGPKGIHPPSPDERIR